MGDITVKKIASLVLICIGCMFVISGFTILWIERPQPIIHNWTPLLIGGAFGLIGNVFLYFGITFMKKELRKGREVKNDYAKTETEKAFDDLKENNTPEEFRELMIKYLDQLKNRIRQLVTMPYMKVGMWIIERENGVLSDGSPGAVRVRSVGWTDNNSPYQWVEASSDKSDLAHSISYSLDHAKYEYRKATYWEIIKALYKSRIRIAKYKFKKLEKWKSYLKK